MRLTMPSTGDSTARIMADGKQVGHAIGRYDDWLAYLWAEAGNRRGTRSAVVYARDLADLRELLRARLADTGPWWTEEDT